MISNDYSDIYRFVSNAKPLDYQTFDHTIQSKVSLFKSLENINLEGIENEINEIYNLIPSIKNIFAKPIIHLKEEDTIVPVEAVRVINNQTINYATRHTELFTNVNKPTKLLTNTYQDNYTIYENIVFSRCVDYILSYTRKHIKLFKDLVYATNKINIDLLDKENHAEYFLALGKLEVSYIKTFYKYSSLALKLIDKLEFIYKTLNARLKRPIYVKCKKVKGKLVLRKTNILGMQKDYHKIYKYMKSIYNDEIEEIKDTTLDEYISYVKMLIIFSIGHFNFEMKENTLIDFNNYNVDFKFKSYQLNVKEIESNNNKGILLTFEKDKIYQILLVSTLDKITVESNVDTYILSNDIDTKDIYISINNTDSFRRIEQILFKGMIYSTSNFDICPFCGDNLIKTEDGVLCPSCRTLIKEYECNNKKYYATKIYSYKSKINVNKNSLFKERQIESLMHFRNITKIDENLNIICPICNKIEVD